MSVLAIGSPPGLPSAGSFALATLVSWLAAEALGAYMLTAWIGGGGNRVKRDAATAVPRSVISRHAGLAFTGLL